MRNFIMILDDEDNQVWFENGVLLDEPPIRNTDVLTDSCAGIFGLNSKNVKQVNSLVDVFDPYKQKIILKTKQGQSLNYTLKFHPESSY